MGIGAVAEIDEDMAFFSRPVLTNPGNTFAAHLAGHVGFAVRHEVRHIVTADPGQRARAFRHNGGGIVRAAGAIMRGANGFGGIDARRFASPANPIKIGVGAAGIPTFRKDLHQRASHFRDGDGGDIGEQGASLAIALAFYSRTLAIRQIVEHRA